MFFHWKSFILASIVMSIIFCFILEPAFIWIGVYQPITWKVYYGFPIYAFMSIAVKVLVNKIYSIGSRNY